MVYNRGMNRGEKLDGRRTVDVSRVKTVSVVRGCKVWLVQNCTELVSSLRHSKKHDITECKHDAQR